MNGPRPRRTILAVRSANKLRGAAALLALLACTGAVAQTYPQRPVRMIVGLPAGGSTDVMARLASAKLTERLGQQVIVDNRPGANGSSRKARSRFRVLLKTCADISRAKSRCGEE